MYVIIAQEGKLHQFVSQKSWQILDETLINGKEAYKVVVGSGAARACHDHLLSSHGSALYTWQLMGRIRLNSCLQEQFTYQKPTVGAWCLLVFVKWDSLLTIS